MYLANSAMTSSGVLPRHATLRNASAPSSSAKSIMHECDRRVELVWCTSVSVSCACFSSTMTSAPASWAATAATAPEPPNPTTATSHS